MTFVSLVLLDIGILLLYSAYKNQSPFEVLNTFIKGENTEESTDSEQ